MRENLGVRGRKVDELYGRVLAQSDDLTIRQYVAAITSTTCVGLFIACFAAVWCLQWKPGLISLLLVGLGIPLLGIFIAGGESRTIGMKICGFCLVAIGIGSICGPVINLYKFSVVYHALLATAGVTVVLSIVGIIYPRSLASWGGFLIGGLTALILVRLLQIGLLSFGVNHQAVSWPWLDYFGALLFSLFIVYDWNQAMREDRTFGNAVLASIAIFLNIANLFIHLLSIFGGVDD